MRLLAQLFALFFVPICASARATFRAFFSRQIVTCSCNFPCFFFAPNCAPARAKLCTCSCNYSCYFARFLVQLVALFFVLILGLAGTSFLLSWQVLVIFVHSSHSKFHHPQTLAQTGSHYTFLRFGFVQLFCAIQRAFCLFGLFKRKRKQLHPRNENQPKPKHYKP